MKRNRVFLHPKFISVGQDASKYSLLSLTTNGIILRDVESGKGKFPKDFDSYQVVESNDIVFCLFDVDETPRTVGLSSLNGMLTGAYDAFSIADTVNPRFINYYYTAVDDIKALRPYYTGLRKVVKKDKFMAISIPIPPIEEQEKIVAYLDKKITLIESCKCQRERELQTLNELKQAEIASVVTRGLNPNAPMKDSGQIQFGEIPAHWDSVKMKYCFTQRSEKGFPNEPVLCATQSKGVIPQSLYENRVVVVNKGFEGLKLVKVGDFVISLRSFQGGIEYAYYQGIISAAYTILTPKDERNSQYFKYLFKSHPFIQLLQTCVTGIREGQNINYAVLGNNFIPIPPIEEQNAIVEYIEAKTNSIDKMIDALKAEIDRLTEYKQRLISDVVTGQLNVQDEIA
jgi:type I restriction enzyme S subunit